MDEAATDDLERRLLEGIPVQGQMAEGGDQAELGWNEK